MFKVRSRWNHENSIEVEWNLGKRCNYDCSYCPKEIHDNFSPHTDIELLKRAIDKLCSIGKPIRLSFTGGEPTVHPKFDELLMYANYQDNVSFISVTTNGTRTEEWYRRLLVDQLVISLHFEYDTTPILDKIYKLTVGESSHYISKNVIVQVMAHQNKMQEVRNAVQMLQFFEIPYNVRRVRWTEGDHDVFDDNKYSKEDLEWVLSKDAQVKPNTFLHYKDSTEMKIMHSNDVIKLNLLLIRLAISKLKKSGI